MSDLFVGRCVGQPDTLNLRPGVTCRTGAAAETRGCVDAPDPHVTGYHRALETIKTHQDAATGATSVLKISDDAAG